MLVSSTGQGEEAEIRMEDLCEDVVLGIRDFIHHNRVEGALSDHWLALRLIQAAEKYKIDDLSLKMSKVLLDTNESRWTMDFIIKLWSTIKNIEEFKPLKDRIFKILRAYGN